MIWVVVLFAVTLSSDVQRQQIIDSRSGLYIARLLDRADAVMPEELHEFLHPYLHRLEGQPGSRHKGPELDEFKRLEQWLEGGQGGQRQDGDEPSETSNSAPTESRYGSLPAVRCS